MSESLYGRVLAHANSESLPFNSIQVLSACGEDSSLTGLISALASNDPARVARLGADVQQLIYSAESIIRVLMACKVNREDGSQITDADMAILRYTASGLLTLAASALPAIEDANLIEARRSA